MVVANKKGNIESLGSLVKMGFGLAIGSWLWTIIIVLVACAFFIPGFILVVKERKKIKAKEAEEKEKEKGKEKEGPTTKLIVGYVLMGIGMLLGVGFGSTIFFVLLADEL